MTDRRVSHTLRRLGLAAVLTGAGLVACVDGPAGPETQLVGQLRIRPAFTAGEDPEQLRLSPDSTWILVTRADASAPPVVDTTLPYDAASTELSWIVRLSSEEESLPVHMELRGRSENLYAGERDVMVRAGEIGAVPVEDVEVEYVGPPLVATVEVTPPTSDLPALGASERLSAIARDAGGNVLNGKTFSWETSDPSVATVDQAGEVTAIGEGVVEVSATVDGVTGSAEVYVAQVVAAVRVDPEQGTLTAIGASVDLRASVFDANGNEMAVESITWESSDDSVVTVDDSGVVTAVGEGSAEVSATADGVTGSATLRVGQEVIRVQVTPTLATLTAWDQMVALSATAFDANDHPIAGISFTWTSDDEQRVLVDADGVVTAVGNGPVEVSATVNGVTGIAAIEVWQEVASVVVIPSPAILTALGERVALGATALDANDNPIAGKTFTWASANDQRARVDMDGLVTAVGNGSVDISAMVDGVTGTATVTVAQEVARVAVTPVQVTLAALGETVTLTATALDANDHPVANKAFDWTSADEQRARVDANGVVTAVDNGPVDVSATVDGVTGIATVRVAQEVASVVVTPPAAMMTALGETVTLTATALDANGHVVPGRGVTWQSSDDAIVTVSGVGVADGRANGSAEVRATVDGVTGIATIEVSQAVASVVVTPAEAVMKKDLLQLDARAYDANGFEIAVSSFDWTSADEQVATVSGLGLVVARGAGQTAIAATVSGVSGVAVIAVP